MSHANSNAKGLSHPQIAMAAVAANGFANGFGPYQADVHKLACFLDHLKAVLDEGKAWRPQQRAGRVLVCQAEPQVDFRFKCSDPAAGSPRAPGHTPGCSAAWAKPILAIRRSRSVSRT